MNFKRTIQIIGYPIIRLFYRIKVVGKENFLQDEAFVLCPNHASNLDVFVLYLSLNRPLNFMAKKELFSFKPLGLILKKLGAFPVDREINDISAFKKAFKVLKNGEVLAMFPQGKRSAVIDVDEAKGGAVMIASRAKVPIVPVSITGGYRLWSKVKIKIDKPYYFDENSQKLSVEDIKEISNNIVSRIKYLSEEQNDC